MLDLSDTEAVQRFFLQEVQLGEELLGQGDVGGGVEHLALAVSICGQPHSLLVRCGSCGKAVGKAKFFNVDPFCLERSTTDASCSSVLSPHPKPGGGPKANLKSREKFANFQAGRGRIPGRVRVVVILYGII